MLCTVRRFSHPALTTDSDAVRTEVTRNPALKLLLRLVGLEASAEEAHWVWTVPRSCTPASLDRDARIIDQYLAQPLLIEGELRDQVQRVRAPRARTDAPSDAADDAARPRKRTRTDADGRTAKKRAPRIPRWLDNEFIEDSDEELAFAMADVPRTSSRSASPPALFAEAREAPAASTHTTPATSPARAAPASPTPAASASPKARARPPAHRDPLFLFDSDNE